MPAQSGNRRSLRAPAVVCVAGHAKRCPADCQFEATRNAPRRLACLALVRFCQVSQHVFYRNDGTLLSRSGLRKCVPEHLMDRFEIVVAGDTGVTNCTILQNPPAHTDRPLTPTDVEHSCQVPSGAKFARAVLREVLDEKDFHVSEDSSLDARTMNDSRLTLRQYAAAGQGKSVYRVYERASVPGDSTQPDIDPFSGFPADWRPQTQPQLVVIHDNDRPLSSGAESRRRNWRRSEEAAELVRRYLHSRSRSRSPKHVPTVIVELDGRLPAVRYTHASDPTFPEPLWANLAKYPDQVCVICSSIALRRADASISRHLSWEQTVEDLRRELHLFPDLRALLSFGHLIIRFGVVAALHLWTDRVRDSTVHGELVFAPYATDGVYRDRLEHGDIVGYKSLFVAAIATAIQAAAQNREPEFTREHVREALRNALLASMRAFDTGYTARPWEALATPKNASDWRLPVLCMQAARPAIRLGYKTMVLDQFTEEQRKRWNFDTPAVDSGQTLGWTALPLQRDAEAALPTLHRDKRRNDESWQILRDQLNWVVWSGELEADKPPNDDSLTTRLNAAMAIVLYGYQRVLNREWPDNRDPVHRILRQPEIIGDIHDCLTLPEDEMPAFSVAQPPQQHAQPRSLSGTAIYVPVIRYGRLVLVEREEIESLRSVRNMIKTYAEAHARGRSVSIRSLARPISIAIFGPPGSGKSFAIKEIMASVNHAIRNQPRKLELVEFNMAQFRSVDDLETAVTRISSINNEDRTPVAFFDEFDSDFAGPLGWLKYLLGPMQDGTFYGTRATLRFGPTIFVFAGGVYGTFADFKSMRRQGHVPEGNATDRNEEFSLRKGPDFVSRLISHIDILPIDRPASQRKYVIRRAILLRQFLEQRELIVERSRDRIAMIDEDVAYALLTLDRYRHGVRSMEAVLSMCTPVNGRLEKASLPAMHQLDMHVSAEEFYRRMYRSRYRHLTTSDSAGNGSTRPQKPKESPSEDLAERGLKNSIPGSGKPQQAARKRSGAAKG